MIVTLSIYVIHAPTTYLLSVSDVILIIRQPIHVHTFSKRPRGVSKIALIFIQP